jgi:hypothetical protein
MKRTTQPLVIVTEDVRNLYFIDKVMSLLAPDLKYTGYSSSGYSAALAAVHTLLRRPERPRVLLVMDADTFDQDAAMEKADLIYDYLKVRREPDFKLYMALPSIEILFFLDRDALEDALRVEVSDEMWELGKAAPKKALELIESRYHFDENSLLTEGQILESISRGELFQTIKNFSESA